MYTIYMYRVMYILIQGHWGLPAGVCLGFTIIVNGGHGNKGSRSCRQRSVLTVASLTT